MPGMLRLMRQALGPIARWLGAIPRGTLVDPACFPDDEYPVYCLQCGYALRGLPDGRCPECGHEFVRGHLLVEQYARFRRPKTDRYRRITRPLLVFSLTVTIVTALGMLSPWVAVMLAPHERIFEVLFAHDLRPWFLAVCVAVAVGLGAGLVAVGIEWAVGPPAEKRRAVQAAARGQLQNRS